MKQTIRLNEAQLHKLVVEAVKRVLKNFDDPEDFHEFNANAERSVIKNRPIIDKRHKILSGHDTEPDKTETPNGSVKPKHRVMCPDCGKEKILFQTEKEAQRFLDFNMDAVNPDGTREMRVYFCPACRGFHLSSHKYRGGSKTKRMVGELEKTPANLAQKLCDEMEQKGVNSMRSVDEFLGNAQVSPEVKKLARKSYLRKLSHRN